MSKDFSIFFKDMENLSKTFKNARKAQLMLNRGESINSALFLASYFRLGTNVLKDLFANEGESKSLILKFRDKMELEEKGAKLVDVYTRSLSSDLLVLGSYISSYEPSLRIADLSSEGKLRFIDVKLKSDKVPLTNKDLLEYKANFLDGDISSANRSQQDLGVFNIVFVSDESDYSEKVYNHLMMANKELGFNISTVGFEEFDVEGYEDSFVLYPEDVNRFLSKNSSIPLEINYDCSSSKDLFILNYENYIDSNKNVYVSKPSGELKGNEISILDGDYYMLSDDFFDLFMKSVQMSISLVGVTVDVDNVKTTFTTLDIIAYCISSMFDRVFDHSFEDDEVPNLNDIFSKHFINLDNFKEIVTESIDDQQSGVSYSSSDDDEESMHKLKLMEDVGSIVKESRISGKFTGCMFRDSEIEEIINGVEKYSRNNVVVVGDSGVGLTTLIYGLTEAINEGKSSKLKDRPVFIVNYQEIISGTRFRGEFEERVSIIKENAMRLNAIVVVEDIGIGDNDAGNLETIKSQLSKDVSLIILASNKDYVKHQRFFRNFTRVNVEPLSVVKTVELICAGKGNYETFHNVEFSESIVKQIVDLSDRYIGGQKLPYKAMNLLDLVGAKISDLESETKVKASIEVIVDVLSKLTKIDKSGIHVTEMFEDSNIDLSVSRQIIKSLEEKLRGSIFGQDSAIDAVVSSVLVARSGLVDESKPMASMLFIGPTGVGKTELVKVMSKELSMNLIRLDMSEYMDKSSVNKMIGSSAGYVGYGEGGFLTNQVFNNPNSILLLDEVEKAHPDVLNIFLQVLDNGVATDGSGNIIDFRNCIIIMTSNAGVKRTVDEKGSIGILGLSSSRKEEEVSGIDMEQVESTFRPELRNRIDKIIEFNYITDESIDSIINKSLEVLHEKVKPYGITVDVGSDVIDLIRDKGYNKDLGARPLYRYVKDNVIQSVATLLIDGAVKSGDVIELQVDGDKVVGKKARKKAARSTRISSKVDAKVAEKVVRKVK